MRAREPFRPGTLVHHAGGIYSRGRPQLGGHYWGWVLESVDRKDGSFEYRIASVDPLVGGDLTQERWWGSHHIDETVPLRLSGTAPFLEEDADGREHLVVAVCGFTFDVGEAPLDPLVTLGFLVRCLYGTPCHDDPILHYRTSGERRWRNAVGELEPSTRGRPPIDAWPSWHPDGPLLDLA